MKSRELLRELRDRILAGEDREKLFAEYHARLPYPPKRLASFMAAIVDPEEKRRYAVWNGLLAVLIGVLALGKLFSLFSLYGDLPTLGWGTRILWLGLGLLVPLVFMFGVITWQGPIYSMFLVVLAMGMLQSVLDYLKIQEALPEGDTGPLKTLLGVLVFLSVCFALTLWIKRRAFPRLGFFGAKKNGPGNYRIR